MASCPPPRWPRGVSALVGSFRWPPPPARSAAPLSPAVRHSDSCCGLSLVGPRPRPRRGPSAVMPWRVRAGSPGGRVSAWHRGAAQAAAPGEPFLTSPSSGETNSARPVSLAPSRAAPLRTCSRRQSPPSLLADERGRLAPGRVPSGASPAPGRWSASPACTGPLGQRVWWTQLGAVCQWRGPQRRLTQRERSGVTYEAPLHRGP